MPETQYKSLITLDWRTLMRIAVLGLGLYLLWQLSDLIIAILFSVVIASAVDPIARWLARWNIPRIIAVILFFIFIFSLLFVAAYFILPVLASETYNFILTFPQYAQSFLKSFPEVVKFLPFLSPQDVNDFIQQGIVAKLSDATGGVAGLLAKLFGGLTSVITIIIVSFYLSMQEHGVANFIRLVTPLKQEEYIVDLWSRTQKKIGHWFQGQLLLMLLVALLVFFGLTILGLPYALALAVLMGSMEIIPFAGPVIGAIPGVALAFVQSPALGFLVLMLYIIIQQLEAHVLQPVVMHKALGVNPLVVIVSLLAGAKLGGVIGLLLALPVTVALLEYLSDIEKRKAAARET